MTNPTLKQEAREAFDKAVGKICAVRILKGTEEELDGVYDSFFSLLDTWLDRAGEEYEAAIIERFPNGLQVHTNYSTIDEAWHTHAANSKNQVIDYSAPTKAEALVGLLLFAWLNSPYGIPSTPTP